MSVFVLIIVGIVVFVWSALRSPLVQTQIANRLTSWLTSTLGADVSVKKARYYIRQGLTLQDVLVRCPNGDTLLYVPQLSGYLHTVDVDGREIGIQRAYVRAAQANIARTDSVFNFNFLLEAFNKPDTAKNPWKINVDEITLVQTNVAFNDNGTSHNFSDISIDISDFALHGDSLSARLETFCTGYNGVAEIDNLEMNFAVSNGVVEFDNIKLGTRNSALTVNDVRLATAGGLSYSADIANLTLCPAEFAFLLPQLDGKDDRISLSGYFEGDLQQVSGRSVNAKFSDNTSGSLNFTLSRLDNIDSLTYSFVIDDLNTTSSDMLAIIDRYAGADTTSMARVLNALQTVRMHGEAEGTLSKVDADVGIRTGLGGVRLDCSVQKVGNRMFDVAGTLKSTSVEFEPLLGSDLNLRVDIKAKGRVGDIDRTTVNLVGSVTDISYSGHTIDSVSVDGQLRSKMFNGQLSSFDQNLRFDFDGLVNYSDSSNFRFQTFVYYANLAALGIGTDSAANLSFNVNANFTGPNIDIAEGRIDITDVYYFTDSSYFATDSVTILSRNTDEGKDVSLTSEFIVAEADGDFKLSELPGSIGSFVKQFANKEPSAGQIGSNSLKFNVVATYPHPLTGQFAPWITLASGTEISGTYSDSTNLLNLKLLSSNIYTKEAEIENLNVEMQNIDDSLIVTLHTDNAYLIGYEAMDNLGVNATLRNGRADIGVGWDNALLRGRNSGDIKTEIFFQQDDGSGTTINIKPSSVTMLDTVIIIDPCVVTVGGSSLKFDKLNINGGTTRIYADGTLSDNPDDSLSVDISNLNLGFVSDVFGLKTRFTGFASCQSNLKDLKGENRINGNLNVRDFSINQQRFGNVGARAMWDIEKRWLVVDGALSDRGGESHTAFNGYIDPANFFMYLDAEASHQSVDFLNLFLSGLFSNLEGTFSGGMHLEGELTSPRWYGKLGLEDARLTLKSTKATYIVNDTLEFDGNQIIFNNVQGHDAEGGQAQLNGRVWHRNFKEFSLDLRIFAENIVALNTRASDSPLWYGKTYASGIVDITGSNRRVVDININATTMPKSMFYITMEGRNDLTENDFVTFVSKNNVKNINDVKKKNRKPATVVETPRSITNLNLDLTVTPDAEIQIVFDPTIGDALRSNGSADLNIRLEDNKFSIYGTYLISKGDFTFTLQNVISKRLDLQSGSYVTWAGDPLDATINIDAAYKLRKVPVYSLTLNEEDRDKRVPVNCHLLMTNKLVSPTIGFSIDMPSTTTKIEEVEQLNNLPEDDLNKQVINLLVLNKFYPLTSVSDNSAGSTAATMGVNTASELLSNQLSKWISQVSTAFDLGVAYRPETEISSEEYELALSTSLWDDRITVSSNFDVSNQTNPESEKGNNTQYTTDFSVELKLNKKGNVRLRAFQKVNEDLIYDDVPYTRGLGIFYTEDFNTFGELWRRWRRGKVARKPSTDDNIQ